MIHVTDLAGRETTFQTYASDNMKWALAWTTGDSLVLYSADMGTTAYDVRDGSILERQPTLGDYAVADDAYAKSYGHPPRTSSTPSEPAAPPQPRRWFGVEPTEPSAP